MQKSWVHQLLCSFTLGLVTVSVLDEKGNSPFLGKLADPVYWSIFPLFPRAYSDTGLRRTCLFFGMALFLGAVIFLAILALSYVRPLRSLLLLVTGALCIAVYPSGCIWHEWRWFQVSAGQAAALLLEIVVVVIFAVLYFSRKWCVPTAIVFTLLALHFGFWLSTSGAFGRALQLGRAYGFSYLGSWLTVFDALLLSILSFLSSYAWAAYVRHRRVLLGT